MVGGEPELLFVFSRGVRGAVLGGGDRSRVVVEVRAAGANGVRVARRTSRAEVGATQPRRGWRAPGAARGAESWASAAAVQWPVVAEVVTRWVGTCRGQRGGGSLRSVWRGSGGRGRREAKSAPSVISPSWSWTGLKAASYIAGSSTTPTR